MCEANDWRSSSEAAGYLGVTPPTLYRLANTGAVASYRIGRVLRYRTSDLEDYLERARVQPGDLDHLVAPGPDRPAHQFRPTKGEAHDPH